MIVTRPIVICVSSSWKVLLWMSRPLLLLDKMSITSKLHKNVLELIVVLRKPAIESAETIPHLSLGHAHPIHESETLLIGC